MSRLHFIGDFELEGELMMSRRYDRDFISLSADDDPLEETNWGLRVAGAWRPRF